LGAKDKEAGGPRGGSKTARVVALLQQKNCATHGEDGWQRHTVLDF
jgi:hypothetical protein